MTSSRLTRIGVFYDGNFFSHVSNYYHYNHERKQRISISGLHEFIRNHVAFHEGSDVKYCHVVDAHYFRGRPRAQDAEQRGILLRERVFDDVLMREGVVTHYLPLGPDGEKGIDVWLALEAYELAILKRFDVSVLVAGDGDFLPLVRKLNTLGTRVMLLAWDFEFMDQNGQDRRTRTAQPLLDEVTYPVMMHQVIEDRSRRTDPLLSGLFVPHKDTRAASTASSDTRLAESRETLIGKIQSIKNGYGFIEPAEGGKNLFFSYVHVSSGDFNELNIGQTVRYCIGKNDRGPCATEVSAVNN